MQPNTLFVLSILFVLLPIDRPMEPSSVRPHEGRCWDQSHSDYAKPKSLFSRLGGKKGIAGIVDEFVSVAVTDERMSRCFSSLANDPVRLARFKKNFFDQLCQATGGPCHYKGRDMKTTHRNMGISDTDFLVFVEDLVKALDRFHVGEREKNELLGALGAIKGDIVGQ